MIWLDLLLLLAPLSLIALFGWHLVKGLITGSIYSAWETIHRELNPVHYWVTMVGYAVIILCCVFAESIPFFFMSEFDVIAILTSLVPIAFAGGGWLLATRKSTRMRFTFAGLALLVSLPIGFVGFGLLMMSLHPNASPGVGVALVPAAMVWLACILGWLGAVAFALANKAIKSRTLRNRH